ncbi:MAG TPA: flagellar basal-body MS-ring/collar protein FliF [Kofleriaceae bacterium]|jgi:flagellar M-ring protein FliF
MPEPTGPRQVVAQARELWSRQPRGRKLLAIGVIVGIAAIVGVTQLSSSTPAWATVADGISPEDSQELLGVLEGRGLPVRLHEGKVEVAAARLDEAHAIAASSGIPHAGKGFELFDGSSLGQSSFAEQVNYRRALQGELARSIAALAQVESARVHLALGKKSVFKDQDEAPTASVELHMHAGQTLTPDQVRGVRGLVAGSIEGLKPEAVVLVDSHGNLLEVRDPSSSDRQADVERSVAARVRTVLERIVGPGKVTVAASANMEEGKVSETQEVYDQEHPALRSETRLVEGADAVAGIGGIAGTRGNLPGAPAAAPTPAGSGSGGNERIQETKNYELSRTVRQTQKPDAQLVRLHVAVVVDYKAGADGKPVARTDAELAELRALATQAAGLEETRGDKLELHSIAFAVEAEPAADLPPVAAPVPLPLIPIAIGAGALLLVIAVVTIVMLRKRAKRVAAAQPKLALALPLPVAELERALEATPVHAPALDEPAVQKQLPARPVRERVIDAVRADLDGTAGVLAAWLAEVPRREGSTP